MVLVVSCVTSINSPTSPTTKVAYLSQTSCHGKCKADGGSNVPTGHLRQAAKDNEPVGVGTRDLVVFLVNKMCRPVNVRADRWDTFDEYLLTCHPDDVFKPDNFITKKGHEGSSQDHFFTNSGLHRLVTL